MTSSDPNALHIHLRGNPQDEHAEPGAGAKGAEAAGVANAAPGTAKSAPESGAGGGGAGAAGGAGASNASGGHGKVWAARSVGKPWDAGKVAILITVMDADDTQALKVCDFAGVDVAVCVCVCVCGGGLARVPRSNE